MSPISRRSFAIHSAHKTIGVSTGLAAFQAAGSTSDFVWPVETETRLRLCLVSGSPYYRSDESLSAFGDYLEQHFDVKCLKAYRRARNNLPGLENLAESDCMVLFAQRLTLDGEQLECVKRYCDRGGSIVALRTGGRALENWPALDREVFGSDYCGYFGRHNNGRAMEVTIAPSANGHPVLEGVGPFTSPSSLYKIARISPDATPLLTGTIRHYTEPVAWTRLHRSGRIFWTTLGHPADFRTGNFIRLLVNAVFWASWRRPPEC